jgi:DNA-binding CsgD family transcriptional regulator
MESDLPLQIELIGAIYDAVIDPARWNDTIDRIRRHLGFQICMMSVVALPAGRVIVTAQSNVPHPYSETIYQYGTEALDQWGGLARIATLIREEPVLYSDFNKLSDVFGKPFYENWSKPQGLVDQLVLVLEFNPRMLANVAFGVHESAPPVNKNQVEGLRVLAPHLRRAAIISGLLEGQAHVAASFEAALNALGTTVVLVDEHMRIISANRRAEAMLAAGDPLRSRDGRLEVLHELVRGQVAAAVAAAPFDDVRLQRGGGIPARREDGGEVVLHVLPLGRRTPLAGLSAVAAIFVAEPSASLNIPMEALQLLYDLRPAEARVLELIAEGQSAARIAATLGIAPSTVKTHTLRLFDKVGVHNRADLMRIARDMSLAFE